jgi:2-(1,2-epoxy-1,2-dihydrophenyl)acetyl-CoA isomerase
MGDAMTLVTARVEHGIGVTELHRPARHNSLVPDLLVDLMTAHREIVDGGAIVGVLAAAGTTFSTGGDIEAIRNASDRVAYAGELVGRLNEAILAIAGGSIPMVAAVHGMVTGGSLGLVLACDHVVMGDRVTIRPWYPAVGFAPDGGWTAMLPAVIGRRRAASVLLTDATTTASEALAWGLADEVVPGDRVRDRAMEAAGRIAGGDPGTRETIRRLTSRDLDAVEDGLERERQEFLRLVDTPAATAGMDRFLRGELR